MWHEIARGIKPLKHRPPTVLPVEPKINTQRIDSNRTQEFFDKFVNDLEINPHWYQSTKRLQKFGKIAIEARLDLHGYTRQSAQDKLQRFIAMAYSDRLKWTLVITGKGHPDNPATLKNLVPQWLEEMTLVTGYAPAKDMHGGAGAFYVRVKG